MGKSSSGSAPSAPDPQETAAAESAYNRLDTFSPSGAGIRHGYTDASGNFQAGVAPEGFQSAQQYLESDTERQLREQLEPASVALTGQIVEDNIYNMPEAARVQDRSDVAGDLFNRTFSLMAPGINESNDRLLSNLQARGIPIGSEAFNETYGAQQRETQDTISRLAMDSNLNAGAEQSRQFGLDAAARQGSISELVAAMGGGYNPPNSTPTGTATPINYSGMVSNQYNAQLGQYQADQQAQMGTASAVGALGGALLKCSRNFKDVFGALNVYHCEDMMRNMPLYQWVYKDDHRPENDHGALHVGPMAEDFQEISGLGVRDAIDPIDIIGVMGAALQSAIRRIDRLEAEREAA